MYSVGNYTNNKGAYPMKKHAKVLMILTALVMIFCLSACSSDAQVPGFDISVRPSDSTDSSDSSDTGNDNSSANSSNNSSNRSGNAGILSSIPAEAELANTIGNIKFYEYPNDETRIIVQSGSEIREYQIVPSIDSNLVSAMTPPKAVIKTNSPGYLILDRRCFGPTSEAVDFFKNAAKQLGLTELVTSYDEYGGAWIYYGTLNRGKDLVSIGVDGPNSSNQNIQVWYLSGK
jgi:hypothetical protein